MSVRRVVRDPWPYLAALLVTSVLTVVLWGGFNALLYIFDLSDLFIQTPELQWQAGWMAVAFYVAWWITFFYYDVVPDTKPDVTTDHRDRIGEGQEILKSRPIVPLPTFLEFSTVPPDPAVMGVSEAIEVYHEKAETSIRIILAILRVSLLLLTLTLTLIIANTSKLSRFQMTLTTSILLVEVFFIVTLVVGMDQLDTCMNRFVALDDEMRYRLTRHYYRQGVYHSSRGLVFLIFSVLLSTILVDPLVTVVGVIFFAGIGYNYWFGYAGAYLPRLAGLSTNLPEEDTVVESNDGAAVRKDHAEDVGETGGESGTSERSGDGPPTDGPE